MIIYQCNRCDEVIKDGGVPYDLKFPLISNSPAGRVDTRLMESAHLCTKCLKSLFEWLGLKVSKEEIKKHEARIRAKL